MRFEVLGSLRASHDGADLTPPGRVQRLLLATLLATANRAVPVDTLADAIWPEDLTGRAPAKLQVAVYRLRNRLDTPDRLTLEAGGYRLRVSDHECDVDDFDALAVRLLMEEMTPEQASKVAREALTLWRGRAFEDVPEFGSHPEVTRWEDRRRWVFEQWCEAEIVRGRYGLVAADLEARAAAEPLYERYAVLLMRALHGAGRTADALAVFERTRVQLRDELGLDPGSELQAEQARVLSGEPVLEVPGPVPASPAQLPPPVGLTGRGSDLAALGEPGETRLCVVTGMAGIGKTATALAWAHRHREAYEDGQLFCDLRGFSDDPPVEPAAALEVFLRSLGVPNTQLPAGLEERAGLFRSLVASRRILIVLDNARSSQQVRPLLPGGSSCTVLVTSRDSLPGLSAREGAAVVELQPLSPAAAIELLVSAIGARAQAAPEAVRKLARICGELPLALRVVAQQVITRTDQPIPELVAEIADERDRLDLLDVGDGAATDIRAVLSWSYECLDDDAARLFRLFGLLPGADADVPALAALAGRSRREVRRSADALSRAHLIERTTSGRYRQHDLLCAYAAELGQRRESAEERAAAHSELVRFYARSAASADCISHPDGEYNQGVPVEGGGEPMEFDAIDAAQRWLDRERHNVLAALDAAETEEPAAVFTLARAYSEHLRDNCLLEDGLRLHTLELELAQRVGDTGAEHSARMGLGNVLAVSGDFDGADDHYRAAVELSERSGDELGRAAAIGNLGTVAMTRGYVVRAQECFEEAVGILRGQGSTYSLAIGLYCLGACRLRSQDPAGAEPFLTEALQLCDDADLPFHRPDVLIGLARVALDLGEPARAERIAADAYRLAGEVRASNDEALALAERGRALMALGQDVPAHELLREATTLARGIGNVEDMMAVLAAYTVATAELQVAVAMFRESISFASEHGFRGYEAELSVGLADALERRGEHEAAAAELVRAVRLYTELEDPQAEVVAARLDHRDRPEVPRPRRRSPTRSGARPSGTGRR